MTVLHADDDGGLVEVAVGSVLEVRMPEGPTGYQWRLESVPEPPLDYVEDAFVPPDAQAPGAFGERVFVFTGDHEGEALIRLRLVQPWAADAEPAERFTATVRVREAGLPGQRGRMDFPEPSSETAEPTVLFARYLDFYRETVLAKAEALDESERRVSRLPSGWTPLELLHHLAHMEQRWFVWGFLGEQVAAPWGDERDDRWHVPRELSLPDIAEMLRGVGVRTAAVLASTPLDTVAATGGRFEDDPPTLAWICFHVLQEYARHAGHLDVAVEVAGGPTGE